MPVTSPSSFGLGSIFSRITTLLNYHHQHFPRLIYCVEVLHTPLAHSSASHSLSMKDAVPAWPIRPTADLAGYMESRYCHHHKALLTQPFTSADGRRRR